MTALSMLREAASRWINDNSLRLAAALAFYTLFSLAPLLAVVTAIAGFAFGDDAARGYLDDQLQGLIGRETADLVQEAIAKARQPTSGALAAVTGLTGTLIGATAVFAELQASLNAVWEASPSTSGSVWRLIRIRLTSFALIVAIGFLLLVSLILSAVLAAVGTFLGGVLPVPAGLLEAVNFVLSFAVITTLFAMIFKILPDVDLEWDDVWFGAAATALLFTVGKSVIGFYIVQTSVASTYGAAGALVLLLLWVYYSALILFFGAELTRVYTLRRRAAASAPARREPRRERAVAIAGRRRR